VRRLFERLDPRSRIVATVSVTAVVASTPRETLAPFIAYLPLCLLLILTGRASGYYLVGRCLAASPFILLASGLLALQGGWNPEDIRASLPAAIGVACKGYTASLLLAFLTATTSLSELLWGLRRLRSPQSLNLILGVMHRYTGLLSEEYARMERARDCRTVRPLGWERFSVATRQLGALVLRSWDRAERVHAAMLARGFNGVWPAAEERALTSLDIVFVSFSLAVFLSARIFIP
jgi:cobalt/nickel transport system permease protein